MADVELDVLFEDDFSGPSKSAGGSAFKLLEKLDKLAGAADRASRKLNKIAPATSGVNRKLTEQRSIFSSLESKIGGFAMNVGRQLMTFGTYAVAAFAAASVAAAGFFTKAVMEAGMLKERAVLAFEALVGNGEQAFRDLRQLALDTGTTMQQAFEGTQAFLRAGFAKGDAERFFKRMQDLSLIGVTEETRGRMVLAMSQIKGAGKLQGDELRQLQETGLNVGLIWENISKEMGISVEKAMKLKEQGKVGADVALRAIEQAMAQLTASPTAGGAREKFLEGTLTGAMERVKSLWSIALSDIAEAAGPAFRVINKAMDDLTASMQAGDFEGFKKTIGETFNALGRIAAIAWDVAKQLTAGFSEVMASGGLQEINKELGTIFDIEPGGASSSLKAIGQAAAFAVITLVKLGAIGAQIGMVFGGVAATLDSYLGPVLKTISVNMDTITLIAKILAVAFLTIGAVLAGFTALAVLPAIMLLGYLAGAFIAVVGAVYGVVKAVQALASYDWGALLQRFIFGNDTRFFDAAWNWGKSLIDGLVGGIQAGVGRVQSAVNSLSSSISGSFTGFWGISSPSTRMEGYTQDITRGGTKGFDAGAPEMQRAMVDLVALPPEISMASIAAPTAESPAGIQPMIAAPAPIDFSNLAGAMFAGGAAAGDEAGRRNVEVNVNISVQGAGGHADEEWERLRPRVRREIEMGLRTAGEL